MTPVPTPQFGDLVRIRHTAETEGLGVAGREGPVFGESVPSASGVPVIGDRAIDYALAVHFDDRKETLWFSPNLVEFVSHDPGTVITLKGVPKRWVRQPDGSWREELNRTQEPISAHVNSLLDWLRIVFGPREG